MEMYRRFLVQALRHPPWCATRSIRTHARWTCTPSLCYSTISPASLTKYSYHKHSNASHLMMNSYPFYACDRMSLLKCQQMNKHTSKTLSLKDMELTLSNDVLAEYVESLVLRYESLNEKLLLDTSDEDRRKLDEERVMLEPLTHSFKDYQSKKAELRELGGMLEDPDLAHMAKEEITNCEDDLQQLEQQILRFLVPPEYGDHNDIILELTAGVGGQEAMLFTQEMFRMYEKFAIYRGWSFGVITYELSELGGVRRASASISGQNVYKYLKYESGVHRVQRVPQTEKTGRMHTSTMTVAILPQPSEIDIEIHPNDLKIDTFRASGAGGQHVNKTESAVRITHIPTGMVAECQAGRSQIQNRTTALQVLRSRLYNKELEAQLEQRQANRKIQVGTGGRAEKIRTYNYNQDRVTDHRVSGNVYGVDSFLSGGDRLQEVIDSLHEEARREQLVEKVDQWMNQRTP